MKDNQRTSRRKVYFPKRFQYRELWKRYFIFFHFFEFGGIFRLIQLTPQSSSSSPPSPSDHWSACLCSSCTLNHSSSPPCFLCPLSCPLNPILLFLPQPPLVVLFPLQVQFIVSGVVIIRLLLVMAFVQVEMMKISERSQKSWREWTMKIR